MMSDTSFPASSSSSLKPCISHNRNVRDISRDTEQKDINISFMSHADSERLSHRCAYYDKDIQINGCRLRAINLDNMRAEESEQTKAFVSFLLGREENEHSFGES